MKNNKSKILSLVMVGLLAQTTLVYAADKKQDLDNVTPGYGQEEIQKSSDRVNSFTNTFTGTQIKDDTKASSTKKTDEDKKNEPTSENNATIVPTRIQESTGNKGDFWGMTQDGKWILIERGNPVFGWKMVRGKWYYMDVNGIMQTGWLSYNGKWYYLMSSGEMATNRMVDGCWLNSQGVWS